MIKYLMLGFWICALALGSSYATILMSAQPEVEGEGNEVEKAAIEQVRTKRLSIPIIGEGRLKGYVLAQFVFHVNQTMANDMSIRPDIFLVDEAFKVIFSGEAVDFRSMEKPDASALSAAIRKNVNERFGTDFLQEVLVQELNFVPQERFRGGSLQGESRFG
jgi:hypothetical protein